MREADCCFKQIKSSKCLDFIGTAFDFPPRMHPFSMRIVVFVCFVCVSICLPLQLCLNVIKLSLFFFGLAANVFISMQFSNAAETKLIISSRVETTGWEMCWPLRNCSDNYPTYLTHLQAVRRITISLN